MIFGMRLVLALSALCLAAPVSAGDPELLFREDWKETAPAIPVTQEHVSHPGLIVERHGPGASVIKKSHHDWVPNDPYYVWSGLADGTWAVSLTRREGAFDLSGEAKVRWRAKQAGFRELRLILKLADGGWLVSDQADGPSEDWRVHEFSLPEIRWRSLDIEQVVEGKWVEAPDLSRVAAVGFTDLMPGGRSAACSRLDWIEVWGSPSSR